MKMKMIGGVMIVESAYNGFAIGYYYRVIQRRHARLLERMIHDRSFTRTPWLRNRRRPPRRTSRGKDDASRAIATPLVEDDTRTAAAAQGHRLLWAGAATPRHAAGRRAEQSRSHCRYHCPSP